MGSRADRVSTVKQLSVMPSVQYAIVQTAAHTPK